MSVLAVVLDGADEQLLWRWARDGRLPFLADMLEHGASAKLESPAAPMHEAEWVTLTTGTNAGSHGVPDCSGSNIVVSKPNICCGATVPRIADAAPGWPNARTNVSCTIS